jgi:predicted enzyme related to lactoylglutathione lyase
MSSAARSGRTTTRRRVHIEIPADDTAEARRFWGSLFGWQFEAYPGAGEYHMTQITETSGAAVTGMEPGKRGTRTYFDVEDIEAGAGRVRELGGEADAPMPVPGMGWFATCRDPHGNEFGLWQTDPSAPAPAA